MTNTHTNIKRIGIDARLYFQTGVGVYVRNLLHYLQELDTSDIQFYIYVMSGDEKKINFTAKNFILRPVPYRWHSFAEQIGFAAVLYKDSLDLMHFTYFSYPVLYKKKFISTIHDTTLLTHKTGQASTKNSLIYEFKHVVFKWVLVNQIQNSTTIITPTKTVKDQLIQIYGQKYEAKITPIYEGVDYALMDAQENTELKNKFTKPYFLYVGNFYPHKNVERLIEAFSNIEKDVQLVLVGPKNYFSDRLTRLINPPAASLPDWHGRAGQLSQHDRIIFYSNASNEDLKYLYKHAEAYIQPSLSEGFGLPLVEAMHFGIPIIASDIPVFKELLEQNYTAFDPNNTEDIHLKITTFLERNNKPHYTNLLKKYSFQAMTEQTKDIYQQLA